MNNLFTAIPKELKSELIEKLVDSDDVTVERIVSRGHKSPETGWYDQDQNEWVLLLQGEAKLLFDDDAYVDLKVGDYIDIPAHKKHKVEWTAPDIETVWLAVFYRS
jgi:cupin 2 domain-containing protein